MSEEEYNEGEEEYVEEGEFGDTFLSHDQANGDINVLLIPKFDFNVEQLVETTVKVLKRCKTSDEAYDVLITLCNQISTITVIQNAYEEIQDKVSALEELIGQVQ